MNFKVNDLVEFEYHVFNGGDFKAKAIYMYDIGLDKYFWYFIEDEYKYYYGRFEKPSITRFLRVIDVSDDIKRLLIKKSIYTSASKCLKSRWWEKNRASLSKIWKNINKNKQNLFHRVTAEYTNTLTNGSNIVHNYLIVGIWLIEYTGYTKVSADGLMKEDGILNSVDNILLDKK